VEGDELRFRIEVVRDSSGGEYYVNLWRIENYRIQPTFPQKDGSPAGEVSDEEILVKDLSTLDGIKADDSDKVLQLALKVIQEKFT